jgi:hypothetical protein
MNLPSGRSEGNNIFYFPIGMLCLLKLFKPESLHQCFSRWVELLLPNGVKKLTVLFYGKKNRSTGK